MSYGLEIFNASGVRTLSVTARLTRLIHTRSLAVGESGSVDVPDFDESTCVAMAVPRVSGSPQFGAQIAHSISWVGTTISWAPGHPIYGVATDLLVFAYR